MKMKKFISAFAALTMSVSCFAGLTMTANAEVQAVDIGNITLVASGSNVTIQNGATAQGKDNVYDMQITGNGARSASYDFSNASSSTSIKISTDINIQDNNNGSTDTIFYVGDGTNPIVNIAVPSYYNKSGSAPIKINGVDVSSIIGPNTLTGKLTYTGWFKLEVVANFTEHTAEITITDETTPSKTKTFTVNIDESITKADKIYMSGHCYSQVYIHDFSVSNLTAIPSYSIADHTLSEPTAQEKVNITNAQNLESVTATSSNEAYVQVVSADTTGVTVKGVAEDSAAEITVVGKSADGAYTTKKFTVKTSDVELYTVTVNYFKEGTSANPLKTADVYTDQAAGSAISELIPDAVLYSTDKSFKYRLKEVKEKVGNGAEAVITTPTAEAPYTVKEGNTVVNVYYTEHAAIPSLTIKYVDNAETPTVEYGSKVVTLTDKYDGDEAWYSIPAYVAGEDHKVVAQHAVKKNNTELNSGTSPFSIKTTLDAAKTTINAAYEKYEGVAYFYEQQDMKCAAGAGSTNGNFSNGAAERPATPGDAGATAMSVVEPGEYKISYVAAAYNANNHKWVAFTKNGNDGITISAGADGKGQSECIQDEHGYVVDAFDTYQVTANKQNIRTIQDTLMPSDKFYIVANQGDVVVDYVLFEKTADITPEHEVVTDNPEVSLGDNDATFKELIDGAGLTTKTIAFTVYDNKETDIPTLSINGAEASNPGWTAVTVGGTRIFYVQFMAAETDFENFGTVKVTYGGKDYTIDLTGSQD